MATSPKIHSILTCMHAHMYTSNLPNQHYLNIHTTHRHIPSHPHAALHQSTASQSPILLSRDLDFDGALDLDFDRLLAPDPERTPAIRFGVGGRRELRRLRVLLVLMVERVSAACLCALLVQVFQRERGGEWERKWKGRTRRRLSRSPLLALPRRGRLAACSTARLSVIVFVGLLVVCRMFLTLMIMVLEER